MIATQALILGILTGFGAGVGGSYFFARHMAARFAQEATPAELLAMLPPEVREVLAGLKNG